MSDNLSLRNWIQTVAPILEGSLDAVAVVDDENRIQYANSAMKTILKLRPADLKKPKKFCEYIKLAICTKGCCIDDLFKTNKAFRHDESPAELAGDKTPKKKMRVVIHGVPLPVVLLDIENPKVVGAVIMMRDSTAEVLVQAKYHKIAQTLAEREAEVEELKKLNWLLRRKP